MKSKFAKVSNSDGSLTESDEDDPKKDLKCGLYDIPEPAQTITFNDLLKGGFSPNSSGDAADMDSVEGITSMEARISSFLS